MTLGRLQLELTQASYRSTSQTGVAMLLLSPPWSPTAMAPLGEVGTGGSDARDEDKNMWS